MGLSNFIDSFKDNQLLMTGIGLSGAGILTFWVKDVPRRLYQLFKREFTTELIITSQNGVYHKVLKWIEKKYSNKNFRKLKLSNGMWGNSENSTTSIGYGSHFIRYKNTALLINLSKEENSQSAYDKETIIVTKLGRSRKLYDDLIKEVETIETDVNKTKVYKMEECWIHVKDQNKRDISSVFLDKSKKDFLIDNLMTFISREEWYEKNGIPYQLGILLYGTAGTGKTSLIKAIAGYLNYHIYYLPTQKLGFIERAMSTLPEKCIVVIEDIDTNILTHSRENKDKDSKPNGSGFLEGMMSISLSEVLNALDGMFSAHGRILIATTNHIESLDPALVRSGRIDIKMEIGFINHEVLEDFLHNFFPENHVNFSELKNIKLKDKISVSMLQDMVLKGKSRDEIIKFAAN
jgi:chaperone BCS1